MRLMPGTSGVRARRTTTPVVGTPETVANVLRRVGRQPAAIQGSSVVASNQVD
jgi:hypothetical protein